MAFPLISSQEDNRNADDIPSMNCRNSMSRTHSREIIFLCTLFFTVKIFRENQKADTSVQAKRTRRATQTQKTKLKATGSFISMKDEYSLNSSGPYTTPQKFGKQIQQHTYKSNRNFPKSKAMQCAIINHQICQRLNSPTTQNTMSQIIDRSVHE